MKYFELYLKKHYKKKLNLTKYKNFLLKYKIIIKILH